MADIAVRSRECPAGESIVGFANRFPWAFYDRLRAMGSPVWDATAGAWLIHDLDQCWEWERDESHFANAYVNADPVVAQVKGGGANITLSRDDEHIRLRRLHTRLLSAANVESFRATHIGGAIDAALDRLVGRDCADLHADYAAQIPIRVICSLLGVPIDAAMVDRILELNAPIVRFVGSGFKDPVAREQALESSRQLNETLRPFIVARRQSPTDDFISEVWRLAPEFGLDLDEDAALGLCRELFIGGADTTLHGIANALYLLLNDAEMLAKVKQDRGGTLSALVEESLRLLSVVQFRHRICVVATKVGDVTIEPGETVMFVHGAVNRDPAYFACPEEVDLERPNLRNHLAFGRGTRSCVGAQLTRVETRDALSRLIDRYPGLRLDEAAEAPYFTGMYMRSMGPLHAILGEPADAKT